MTDTVLEIPPDVSANGGPERLHCPECGTEVPALARGLPKAWLAGHRKHKHGVEPARTNTHKKERARARIPQDAPNVKAQTGVSKTQAPSPARKPRKSVAKWLGRAYGGLGSALVPGRAGGIMAWQAPASGRILDRAAAGSWVDRHVLQRFASESERWEGLGALVLLPAIAVAYDRNPAIAESPIIRDIATDAIIDIAEEILDKQISDQRDFARLEAKAREAGYEGGLREMVAQVMELLLPLPAEAQRPAHAQV
jgi:hypothetical protein